MFIEHDITDDWESNFPDKLAKELLKLGYAQSGEDGVFKLPKAVSKQKCYRALVDRGYKWNKEVYNGFKKEYVDFEAFRPQ